VISSNTIQNAYNLTGDRDITKQLEDLRKKIYTQECINAQNEYDLDVSKARNNISNKYYLLADQDFTAAFKVTESYPNCMIDKTEATNLKNGIQPAIDFLNKLIEIDEDVNLKKYSNAIAVYIDAEKVFKVENLDNALVFRLFYHDYIAKQENTLLFMQ